MTPIWPAASWRGRPSAFLPNADQFCCATNARLANVRRTGSALSVSVTPASGAAPSGSAGGHDRPASFV
jgi:hypothetical protein